MTVDSQGNTTRGLDGQAARQSARLGARPHDSVLWGLQGWFIEAHWLPMRESNSASGLLMGMTEAILLLSVSELVKQIELDLKKMLLRFLRQKNGLAWWDALPSELRHHAERRHRWASGQIGSKRAGSPRNIAWLSMGDLIRAIGCLVASDWATCLQAQTRRRRALERALLHIKAFRDNQLAHPKPHPISSDQLAVVCRAAHSIPQILRPSEWARVLALVGQLNVVNTECRNELLRQAVLLPTKQIQAMRTSLERLIMASSESTQWPTPIARMWHTRVIQFCGQLDPGGYVFFGRKEQ